MRRPRLWAAIALFIGLSLLIVEFKALAVSPFEQFALASVEIGSHSDAIGEAPDVIAPLASLAEPERTGNPLWSVPISKLSLTRERPLFSPTRRPPPPTIAAAPEPPPLPAEPVAPETPPFTLVGTIIGEDNRIGIFLNESSKLTTRLRQGEGDSGWTLRSIDPHSAVFEGYGRMVTLIFPQPKASGDPASAAPSVSRISGTLGKRNAPMPNGDGL